MRINEVLHLSEHLCVRPKKKFTKINCCKCSSEAQNSPPTRTALHTSKKSLLCLRNQQLSYLSRSSWGSIFTGLHFLLDSLYWNNRPTSFSPHVSLVPDFSFGVDAPSNRTDKRMLWRWSTARRTCGSLRLLILPVCWVHQDMRWTKYILHARVFRIHAISMCAILNQKQNMEWLWKGSRTETRDRATPLETWCRLGLEPPWLPVKTWDGPTFSLTMLQFDNGAC